MKRFTATFAAYAIAGTMLALMFTPDRMVLGLAIVATAATLFAIIEAVVA